MKRRAVFLDRDGTLVRDEGYMSRPEQLRLIGGAATGVRRLMDLGYVPVVVTNQSGVGRGLIKPGEMEAMTRRLKALFAKEGVRFAGVYVCPHHPDDGCRCRKPAPGLLKRAARELKLDLKRSVMIGDAVRDVGAGRAVGARTVLVMTGEARLKGGSVEAEARANADFVAKDLRAAAAWVVKGDRDAASDGG